MENLTDNNDNDNNQPDELTNLWLCQPLNLGPISLATLREMAQKHDKQVRWRNLREYVGIAIAIASFGYYISVFSTPLVRVGCGLVIAGALWVAYLLHKRGSARTGHEDAGLTTCLVFHRRELERQRDLLRSVWAWYLLPFVPGLGVFLSGLAIEQLGGRWAPVAIFALVCVAACILIERLNRWGARQIQRQIDGLDGLERD